MNKGWKLTVRIATETIVSWYPTKGGALRERKRMKKTAGYICSSISKTN